jgi:hypothetical protein
VKAELGQSKVEDRREGRGEKEEGGQGRMEGRCSQDEIELLTLLVRAKKGVDTFLTVISD